MKNTIIYIAVLLLLASPALAVNAELKIGDVSGGVGKSVEIPVNMKTSVAIGSVDLAISYDTSALQLESVAKGSLTGNGMFDYSSKTPGKVTIAMANPDGMKGDGSIALLKFKILGKEGDKSTVKIDSASANEAATFIDVRLDNKAGDISVVKSTPAIGAVYALAILAFAAVVTRNRERKPKL